MLDVLIDEITVAVGIKYVLVCFVLVVSISVTITVFVAMLEVDANVLI
jgi:hypothetical protein